MRLFSRWLCGCIAILACFFNAGHTNSLKMTSPVVNAASQPIKRPVVQLRNHQKPITPRVQRLLVQTAGLFGKEQTQGARERSVATKSTREQQVLVVFDSTEQPAERARANVSMALEYARLKNDILDLASTERWPRISNYTCLLLVTNRLDRIEEVDLQQIRRYVSEGGGLAVVIPCWNPKLASLFGVASFEGPRDSSQWDRTVALILGLGLMLFSLLGVVYLWRHRKDQSVGRSPKKYLSRVFIACGLGGTILIVGGVTVASPRIYFTRNLLPALEGVSVSSSSCYKLELQSGTPVQATSSFGDPVHWVHSFGRGKVAFWNTHLLSWKWARGLVVHSIMKVQNISVQPIANLGVIQIDDFPRSVERVRKEPIKSEFGLTVPEFYEHIWLPDMLGVASEYNVRFTFLAVFNYNGRTKPPFDFSQWDNVTISSKAGTSPFGLHTARMIGNDHELGLHGYNHRSLHRSQWQSREMMKAALDAAAQRWEEDKLGPPPQTYVPPNNIYDADGAQALTESFPTLRVIAGTPDGKFEEGGQRKFEPEPWNQKLFCLPRYTAGYSLTDKRKYAMISQLETFGVWTHFLHPDDIFSESRNPRNLPWRGEANKPDGLYDEFVSWLQFVRDRYPWLRFVRTAEGHQMLREYLGNDIKVMLRENEVVIHSTTPTSFRLRLNGNRRVVETAVLGAELLDQRACSNGTFYTFEGHENRVTIGLNSP